MALIDFFKWSKECQRKPKMKRKKGKNVEKERKKTVTFFFFSSVTVVSDFCLFTTFSRKNLENLTRRHLLINVSFNYFKH